MRIALICSIFGAGLLLGCERGDSANSAKTEVKRIVAVAAASDLSFVFGELEKAFEETHPQIDVQVTLGSSGSLFAQISNKAPFDLFLSADADYPKQLVEKGDAFSVTQFCYAIGRMVVWVPRDSPLKIDSGTLDFLLDPTGVKRIAIANPRHAPYGRAAEAVLRHFEVYDQVRDRLVFGENVAQAAQFVESGSADVGLVSLSLASASSLKEKGRYWIVPLDSFPRLNQTGVITAGVRDRESTEAFRLFLASESAKKIFNEHGFLTSE